MVFRLMKADKGVTMLFNKYKERSYWKETPNRFLQIINHRGIELSPLCGALQVLLTPPSACNYYPSFMSRPSSLRNSVHRADQTFYVLLVSLSNEQYQDPASCETRNAIKEVVASTTRKAAIDTRGLAQQWALPHHNQPVPSNPLKKASSTIRSNNSPITSSHRKTL